MNDATAIHKMVDRCHRGDYPPMVAKVRSGWVVMGEAQIFAGYCLLLPDPVVPHLNALLEPSRTHFLSDMAAVGEAIIVATSAIRINYAIFGNVEPALHAHLFPRCADEPAAKRTAQPWAQDWNAAPKFSEQLHGDLKRRIASILDRMSVTR